MPTTETAAMIFPFQNCSYYWFFAAWMAYYINHPLYTPPSKIYSFFSFLAHFTFFFLKYLYLNICITSVNVCVFSAYGEQQVKTAVMIFLVNISCCAVANKYFILLFLGCKLLITIDITNLYPQFCQLGSFSIHIALRNLKQPGELMRQAWRAFPQHTHTF